MNDISSHDQIQPHYIPDGVVAAAVCLEHWDPRGWVTGIVPEEYRAGDVDFPEWALWDDGTVWDGVTGRSWTGNGAVPAPEQAPPQGRQPAASVRFMLTQQMKADLAARGFTPEQIRNMTPQQAHENLRADAVVSPQAPAAASAPAAAPAATAASAPPSGNGAAPLAADPPSPGAQRTRRRRSWTRQGTSGGE
jgi:hypothetical protein